MWPTEGRPRLVLVRTPAPRYPASPTAKRNREPLGASFPRYAAAGNSTGMARSSAGSRATCSRGACPLPARGRSSRRRTMRRNLSGPAPAPTSRRTARTATAPGTESVRPWTCALTPPSTTPGNWKQPWRVGRGRTGGVPARGRPLVSTPGAGIGVHRWPLWLSHLRAAIRVIFECQSHIHVLMLDGVYVDGQEGPEFVPAPPLTDDDVQQIVQTSAHGAPVLCLARLLPACGDPDCGRQPAGTRAIVPLCRPTGPGGGTIAHHRRRPTILRTQNALVQRHHPPRTLTPGRPRTPTAAQPDPIPRRISTQRP